MHFLCLRKVKENCRTTIKFSERGYNPLSDDIFSWATIKSHELGLDLKVDTTKRFSTY